MPMNLVLCAVNAKFIHSSLSVHSLMANLKPYQNYAAVKEFTINNSEEFIIGELFRTKPDVVCFSCYIWNIGMIMNMVSNLKKILPMLKIVLGGPEVSYEYENLFESGVDYVIIGEGEKTLKELTEYFLGIRKEFKSIKGIAYKENCAVKFTGVRELCKLEDLEFVYENGFSDFSDRIIYYETSRGCPFNCQYCLSSVDSKTVRLLPLARVKAHLDAFLSAKVRQVKFVDRTFNCNKVHAIGIWEYIIENDNGVTNFHFEIAADLLDDEMFGVLKNARMGQIQFEIGVQSTNLSTLNDIKRKTNIDKLFDNVERIKSLGNIHLHLDLIAGLPNEGYASFGNSFNDVYKRYPQQLQLGFLKLLKGSGLRKDAQKYDIIFKEKAPYEVLYTKDIPFEQMLILKQIEEMVELYYNSNKFLVSLRYIVPLFDSPFAFFERLAVFWSMRRYDAVSHNKMRIYGILNKFCSETAGSDIDAIRNLLKFDLFMCDNVKTLPEWLEDDFGDDCKQAVRAFYNNKPAVADVIPGYSDYSVKQINRMCAVQKFDYDIPTWIGNNFEGLKKTGSFVLFDYKSRLELPGMATFHAKYINITNQIVMKGGGSNQTKGKSEIDG